MKPNHKQKTTIDILDTKTNTKKNSRSNKKYFQNKKNNILSTAKNINNNITKNQDYRQNNKPTKIFQPTHFIK